MTHRFSKETNGPQAFAPGKFFQLGEFLSDDAAGAAFHGFDRAGDRDARRKLDEHMDVVFLDIEFIDWPIIDLTAFFEQVVEAASKRAYQ